MFKKISLISVLVLSLLTLTIKPIQAYEQARPAAGRAQQARPVRPASTKETQNCDFVYKTRYSRYSGTTTTTYLVCKYKITRYVRNRYGEFEGRVSYSTSNKRVNSYTDWKVNYSQNNNNNRIEFSLNPKDFHINFQLTI